MTSVEEPSANACRVDGHVTQCTEIGGAYINVLVLTRGNVWQFAGQELLLSFHIQALAGSRGRTSMEKRPISISNVAVQPAIKGIY